jgi:hypothetical protein
MVDWTEQLREQIVKDVEVTNQLVAAAQAFFVESIVGRQKSADLLARLAKHHNAEWPEKVALHSKGDNADVVARVARAISIRVAGAEAICRLIHRDQLLASGSFENLEARVSWKTDAGYAAGWGFPEYEIPYPSTVMKALSPGASEALCNHDLYLQAVGVPGLSKGVENCLRDAVQCYAEDLYTPCAAMLGSASEGAWLEFGHALAKYLSLAETPAGDALRAMLQDPHTSIAKKVAVTLQQYGDKGKCVTLWGKSGVTPRDLAPAAIWSDVVRDSRNAVHYGVDPTTTNTREKLGVLLLGAVPFFRTLYAVVAST